MKNPFVKYSKAEELTIRLAAIQRYRKAFLLDTAVGWMNRALWVTFGALSSQLGPYLKALIAYVA